jgi:diguanylate cyclase (GGDEF)-like protein
MKSDHRFLDPDFKKRVDERLDEFRDALFKLHDAATRDEKTGIYNHRFFKSVFEMEIEKAKRGKQRLCLVVVDVDFFKKFNDKYGHLLGDKALIEIAKTLESGLRKYDVLARFGGEEFLVLLPETAISRARQVAERLRKSLWEKSSMLKKYGVTISIGVTEYKHLDNGDRMISRADKALYNSKDKGRNRVSVL